MSDYGGREDCRYCSNDEYRWYKTDSDNPYSHEDFSYEDINYCPMCGRKIWEDKDKNRRKNAK